MVASGKQKRLTAVLGFAPVSHQADFEPTLVHIAPGYD